MAKSKLSTPAWITEGYDSPADYAKAHGKKVETPRAYTQGGHKNLLRGPEKSSKKISTESKKTETKKKGKTFKVKRCPKCESNDVAVVGGEKPEWKCKKCGYQGKDINEEELTEEEFMKYLDDKGEEVA